MEQILISSLIAVKLTEPPLIQSDTTTNGPGLWAMIAIECTSVHNYSLKNC